MLVSHLKKFIFTKTQKTAGTSVEYYFEKFCLPIGARSHQGAARDQFISNAGIVGYRGGDPGGKSWYNHMPAAEIKLKLGDEIWDAYFKFTVVRNPFDKLISSFFFHEQPSCSQTQLIRKFRDWVKNGGFVNDRAAYVIDGDLCLDHFIRYENLEEGIKEVCSILSVPFVSKQVPRFKTQFRNHDIPLHDFYDEATIKVTEEKYAFDLDTFGYSFPR